MIRNFTKWAFGSNEEMQRQITELKDDVASIQTQMSDVTEDVKDIRENVNRIDTYLIKANIVFSGENVTNVVKNRSPDDALKYFINCFETEDLTDEAMMTKINYEVENFHGLKRNTEFIVRFKKLNNPSTYFKITNGVRSRFEGVYARKQETRQVEKMKYLIRKLIVHGDIIGSSVNPMRIETKQDGTVEVHSIKDLYRYMSPKTKVIVDEEQRRWNFNKQKQLNDFAKAKREEYADVVKKAGKFRNPNYVPTRKDTQYPPITRKDHTQYPPITRKDPQGARKRQGNNKSWAEGVDEEESGSRHAQVQAEAQAKPQAQPQAQPQEQGAGAKD